MTPADPLKFILAGNAYFTVVSGRTGARFTFRVRQPRPEAPHHVALLSGPDNETDYQYLGTIFRRESFSHGVKSRIDPQAPSARAARWVCGRLLAGKPLTGCELHHEGRCGRCGRRLTVPESITSGFGPECIEHIQ